MSRSLQKQADALRMGAHRSLATENSQSLQPYANYFDIIINTVSAEIALADYLQLLKLGGTMVAVGVPDKPLSLHPFPLILQRRSYAGSLIGSIKETQEMLDFCAAHNVQPDIEMIAPDQINAAYERVLNSDVRYRFVIDMTS